MAGRRVDPRDRPRHEDLGAEAPRLLQRPARELIARDAGREAEVVLDPRGGARPGRPAPRARRRSCAAPPTPRRRRPRARPAPRRRSPCRTRRAAGSVGRPSSSATRRSCGRTTVLPSTTRIVGMILRSRQRPTPLRLGVGRRRRQPGEARSGCGPGSAAGRRSSDPSAPRRRPRAAEAARRRAPGVPRSACAPAPPISTPTSGAAATTAW